MITREELYELVWSTPMIKVAEKFDVSGSYLARVCTALRVPRPERGYWAKLAFGKAAERPALPEPQPGDPIVWSRTDEFPTPTVPKPRPASSPRVPRLGQPVTGTHGLVRGAKEHFLASRKVDEGEHLKPYKKLLVDLTASRSGLDKALGFANDLFNALESSGHRVIIGPADAQLRRERVYEKEKAPKQERQHDPYGYDRLWSPYRPTVVYVDSLSFGLAIVEMTEVVVMRYVNGMYIRESEYVPPKASRRYVDHTWTTKRDLPTGRLRLVVYSPYRSVSWSTWFQETKSRTLTQDIRQIVKSIENEAAALIEKLLHRCHLHYWGDIDTHGFAILDQLRGYFPHAASFLMDRETLLAHRSHWGEEPEPARHDLSRLTTEEAAVYDELRFDRLQPRVRLEQERVGFGWLSAQLRSSLR